MPCSLAAEITSATAPAAFPVLTEPVAPSIEIEEVRIVEIVGLDLQADGGTHVGHTKEVGGIRITKTENKGKINKRLEIMLTD